MKWFFLIFAGLFWGAATLEGQTLSVSSNDLTIVADPTDGILGIGTSSTYSVPNASFMYDWPNPSYTSHIVAMVNGTAYDFSSTTTTSPLVAVGSGLGAYLQITKSITSSVLLTAHYEIVNNPVTGNNADTAMLKFTFSNTGTSAVTLGLRVEIDTMVNGNDGANISINNGASTIPVDTLYTANAGNLPSEWWDYDIPPPGTPNLIGHGAVYNNPYDSPATKPDAMEVAEWPDVYDMGQWTTGILGASIDDSSVVYWWTGTGNNSTGSIVVNAGQTISFTTYYGISQIALLTTPTFTPLPCSTNSCTPTNTPTDTSTITPTFTSTLTATFTPSATSTNTATNTFTSTVASTPTITPTSTFTSTFTPTCVPEVWPDPFNPKYAKDNVLKIGCVSPGSKVSIYTLSGEKVWENSQSAFQYGGPFTAVWDGRNQNGVPVSLGVYYYVIQDGTHVLQRGKFLVTGGP